METHASAQRSCAVPIHCVEGTLGQESCGDSLGRRWEGSAEGIAYRLEDVAPFSLNRLAQEGVVSGEG
jgi:hypothetical protein